MSTKQEIKNSIPKLEKSITELQNLSYQFIKQFESFELSCDSLNNSIDYIDDKPYSDLVISFNILSKKYNRLNNSLNQLHDYNKIFENVLKEIKY